MVWVENQKVEKLNTQNMLLIAVWNELVVVDPPVSREELALLMPKNKMDAWTVARHIRSVEHGQLGTKCWNLMREVNGNLGSINYWCSIPMQRRELMHKARGNLGSPTHRLSS